MAIDNDTSYELTGAQIKDLAQKIRNKADDNTFVGASSLTAGSKGLVPAPAAGDESKVLSGAGTWVAQSGGGSTYTAGNGISIDANDEISIDTSVVAELSDLPTVNDGTLTIQHNGTTKGTFTANQSSASTVNIETIYADTVSPATAVDPITTGMIADGAVTTSKVADGAITNDKIASNTITAGKIAAGAVDTSELAANAVTSAKIDWSTIMTAVLSTNTVTDGSWTGVRGLNYFKFDNGLMVVTGQTEIVQINADSYVDKSYNLSTPFTTYPIVVASISTDSSYKQMATVSNFYSTKSNIKLRFYNPDANGGRAPIGTFIAIGMWK